MILQCDRNHTRNVAGLTAPMDAQQYIRDTGVSGKGLERLRLERTGAMGGRGFPHSEFKFRFGQRVRVLGPHIDAGATGHVIHGSLYPDGRETYSVDIPGGSWQYEGSELEPANGR